MPFCIFADSQIRGHGRAVDFKPAKALLIPRLNRQGAAALCMAFFILPGYGQQVQEAEENSVSDVSTAVTPAISVEPISAGAGVMATEGATEVAVDSLEAGKPEKGELIFKTALGILYDDNIYQTDTDLTADFVALARVGAEFGSRESGNGSFLFGYDATGYTYIDNSDLNGINHAAMFQAALDLPKTKLGASFNYARVSSGAGSLFGQLSGGGGRSTTAEREGAQFAEQDVLGGALRASRDLSAKVVLDSTLTYSARYLHGNYLSSESMNGRLGLGYRVTERTLAGFDGVYGILNADTSPRQTYQNALFKMEYAATGKLGFLGDAGVETRQRDGDGGSDSTGFIFHVQARYAIRERTAVSLGAGRYTEGSATEAGTTVQRTFISTSLDQDVGRKFHLVLESGYDTSDYTSTVDEVQPAWAENYWFGRLGLDYRPNDRSSVGLFYEHRNSDSEREGEFSYRGNRIGIQLAVTF